MKCYNNFMKRLTVFEPISNVDRSSLPSIFGQETPRPSSKGPLGIPSSGRGFLVRNYSGIAKRPRWKWVLVAFTTVFLGTVGVAFAYAVPSGEGQATNPISPTSNNVNLPQSSSGTFNLDWSSFINNSPVQGFINSLQSARSGASGVSLSNIAPSNINSAAGQTVLAQIDDWTSGHLGFRFSAFAQTILGILSWVLGLAKTIVDWLIGFLK